MRRLAILPLIACYGAGVVAGLLRFPAPPLGLALLLLGWSLCRRPAGLALGALGIGVLVGAVARATDADSCAARLPAGRVALTLVALEPADRDAGVVRVRPVGAACRGIIRARWMAADPLEAGRRARVEGRWRLTAQQPRARGILQVTRADPRPGGRMLTAGWRGDLAARIDRLYGPRAPLIDALILNRKGRLDPILRDQFAAAGLVHLLAISGFHVGLVTLWLGALLRLVRVRAQYVLPIAAAGALAYVAFLGWPPAATRAGLLITLVVWTRGRQRRVGPHALLAGAVLLFLIATPWVVLNVGAWLSVSALAGVIHFTRWSDRRLGPGPLRRTLAASVGATLATAPITAAMFGVVSIVGLALNFLALPLAALALPAAVASVVLDPLPGPAAEACASGAGLALDLLEHLARWGSRVPLGHVTAPPGVAAALPWVGISIVVMWLMGRRNTLGEAGRRLAWIATAGLWILLAMGLARTGPDPRGNLRLHFLDVGQGDAAAIMTPLGHWLLVDAGPRSPDWDAGRNVVGPFLRRHRVGRLTMVVLSHAHADHLGGVPWIVEHFRVDQVLEPGAFDRSPLYLEFLEDLDRREIPWHVGRAGMTFKLDGVQFSVLHPDTAWAEWGEDLNEDSVVLEVRYGDFEALFAGDIGFPVERLLHGVARPVEVLKVGHHGSAGSTGSTWLGDVRPQVAVVSVGRNRYGHPSPAALTRLRAAAVEVWRTDREGTILVATDGHRVTIRGAARASAFAATP